MTLFIYTLLSVCLILIQTAVLPFFFHADSSYDLMMMFILYLGFYRSVMEGLPVLLFLGCLMDCLSGGPFGIYMTTYVWLYAAMRGITQYLHVNSLLVLPAAILSGVLLENAIVLLVVTLGSTTISLSYEPVKILLYQMFWAVLTGPVVFLVIKTVHQGADHWFKAHFGRDKKQNDFQY